MTLIRGLNYLYSAAYGADFPITVTAAGEITTPSLAATTSGSSLTLLPITVDVALNGIGGWHTLSYGPSVVVTGGTSARPMLGTLQVLRGVRFLYSPALSASFWIDVAGDGTVTSELPAAVGGYRSLWLEPTVVEVDTAGVSGWHRVEYGPAVDPPTGTLTILAGLSYSFSPALNARIPFRIDDAGSVVTSLPDALRGGLRSLEFLPRVLTVESTGTAEWGLAYGPTGTRGSGQTAFLPGVPYVFQSGGAQRSIQTGVDCSIEPAEFDLSGIHYVLGCEPLVVDSDGDSVLDDADNCIGVANADQLDRDGDETGDACDTDRDGDGVANPADLCPDVPDAAQRDVDGDGVGDVCDDDNDGDGVTDAADNCPADSNPAQVDADGDAIGDACDLDDDGDGFADTVDVCPLLPDAQVDSDSDGAGDVCDGDDDGDGLGDDVDACPGSPLSVSITPAGCSPDQEVARHCPREAFARHGHYVRCVAHVAGDLLSRGLITESEKDRLVSTAARK